MVARELGKTEAAQKVLEDDFEQYVASARRDDPVFRAAYEDAQQLHGILDKLVKLRKALRLTQTEVARRMGVRQPTVSGFETEYSDPRLSTLQRYARAVEATVHMSLVMPADCDWVPDRVDRYTGSAVSESVAVRSRSTLTQAWVREAASPDEYARAA